MNSSFRKQRSVQCLPSFSAGEINFSRRETSISKLSYSRSGGNSSKGSCDDETLGLRNERSLPNLSTSLVPPTFNRQQWADMSKFVGSMWENRSHSCTSCEDLELGRAITKVQKLPEVTKAKEMNTLTLPLFNSMALEKAANSVIFGDAKIDDSKVVRGIFRSWTMKLVLIVTLVYFIIYSYFRAVIGDLPIPLT